MKRIVICIDIDEKHNLETKLWGFWRGDKFFVMKLEQKEIKKK